MGGYATVRCRRLGSALLVFQQIQKLTPVAIHTHRFRVEDENASYYQDLRKKLNEALGRNDNLAGWACIRLDRLQQGYRFVRLMDAHGRPTEGKLFIKVEKTLKKP